MIHQKIIIKWNCISDYVAIKDGDSFKSADSIGTKAKELYFENGKIKSIFTNKYLCKFNRNNIIFTNNKCTKLGLGHPFE